MKRKTRTSVDGSPYPPLPTPLPLPPLLLPPRALAMSTQPPCWAARSSWWEAAGQGAACSPTRGRSTSRRSAGQTCSLRLRLPLPLLRIQVLCRPARVSVCSLGRDRARGSRRACLRLEGTPRRAGAAGRRRPRWRCGNSNLLRLPLPRGGAWCPRASPRGLPLLLRGEGTR